MKNRKIIFTLGILIAVVVTFGFINRESLKDKQQVHENMEILIKSAGREELIGLEEIKSLGEEDFTADLKSSGKPAEEHTYTGVALKKIIEDLDLDLEEGDQLVAKSIDGYQVALEGKEVLEDDNVYLTYKMDGEDLKSKEEGGSGPYQLIIRKDDFSQRWSKHLVEISF